MKKLIAFMIGLSLVLGSANLFAQVLKGGQRATAPQVPHGKTKTAPNKDIKTNDQNQNKNDQNQNKNYGKKVEQKDPPKK